NVGQYDIEAVVTHHDYIVTVETATLTILPREIIATIHHQTQVYGDDAVQLTYDLSLEQYRDELNLDVERVAGDTVNTYLITASTNNENFALTVVDANYHITKRPISASQSTTNYYNGTIQTILLSLSNTIDGDDVFAYIEDTIKDVG